MYIYINMYIYIYIYMLIAVLTPPWRARLWRLVPVSDAEVVGDDGEK